VPRRYISADAQLFANGPLLDSKMVSSSRIQLPAGGLSALRLALAEVQPASDSVATLRRIGFEMGERVHRELAERIGDEREGALDEIPADEFWREVSGLFDELGWGRLGFEELHPGVASVTSGDWAEGEAEGLSTPGCHLTTGLLSDLLGRVAQADIAVLEVECRGRGDDRCLFLFGLPERLEDVFEEVRSGTAYGEALASLG